jgi:hypothetical protein
MLFSTECGGQRNLASQGVKLTQNVGSLHSVLFELAARATTTCHVMQRPPPWARTDAQGNSLSN